MLEAQALLAATAVVLTRDHRAMQATMEAQALLAQQVTPELMAHQEATVMQARQQPSVTTQTSQAERLVLVEQEAMAV